jgi:DNA-binding transcriptional LysR family regulator
MNLTHLLAFYEAARTGSVSSGADVLHVSQPAISREITQAFFDLVLDAAVE